MNIAIVGPLNLQSLNLGDYSEQLPHCHEFPMYSLYINSLIDRGYFITAITLSRDIDELKHIKLGKLDIYIVPRKPKAGRRLFQYERSLITNIINKANVDIVHALWSYEYAWAALNSKSLTVTTLQDHAFTILKYQVDFFRLVRYLMNVIVMKKSKYLITNSQYLFSLLSNKRKKISRIIPNFFSNRLLEYSSVKSKKQDYLLTICSGFGRRKNVQKSIAAFSILRKKYPHIKYRIIGTQMEFGGKAYRYADKHNMTENIEFLGRKPFSEVIEHIKNAKLVIHPSLEESFGMAVLEPMLIGTNVIGGEKSGNVPYLLLNGKTGLTCNVKDPESIALAIDKILENESFASIIRENAFRFAKNNFNEEKVIDQHINYYKHILDEVQ